MTRHPLHLGIGDVGLAESLRAVIQLNAFRTQPLRLRIDEIEHPINQEWPWEMLGATRHAFASWTPEWEDWRTCWQLGIRIYSKRLTVTIPEAFSTIEEALAILEPLPFAVCSLGTVFPDEWGPDREQFGFGDAHLSHGWGCAFRGVGHDLLVSRRWLDFGPWRAIHRPGDLTLIQFHDLDVDPDTAYTQGHPGHDRIGISDDGGFLQLPYPFVQDVGGLYAADARTLEIVVPPGGRVEQARMQDACAVRYMHRIEAPRERPIERISYVFLDDADARAHLHELWLRELECWVVDGGGKRRLDLDYHPTPVKPALVLALEAGP